MGWLLPENEVKPFARNKLRAVIMQLRFHPILKIGERLADFQEKIRPRFPGYEMAEGQTLDLTPLGPQVRVETMHRFRADGGQPIAVSLGTSAVSLEYSAHRDRAVLLEDVGIVLRALRDVYAPIAPVRLGLRYVNVIDREAMSHDLKRPVAWAELLTSAFASVPGGLAVLDDTVAFVSELSAPRSRGTMTIRYGLLRDPFEGNVPQFRLDTDRYVEGGFSVEEVGSLLNVFSSDIFQVFMTAAGPALLEWMTIGEEGTGK